MRPAVFFDRDGTLIENVHHLVNPADVRLIPGAADAVRILQALDYACVVVTNQSVVGRGKLSVAGLDAVHHEMHRQLASHGVKLDGVYFCPVAPLNEGDRASIEHPDRKPGPGMLQRAAKELLLDLARSWIIGDMISDTLAGRNAGCIGGILVRTGNGASHEAVNGSRHDSIDHVAENVLEAAQWIARRQLATADPALFRAKAASGVTE